MSRPPKLADASQKSSLRARGRGGKVTLADVAEHAGVSTATVSRAFNNPGKVAEPIRERVLASARVLKWIPNAAGKALASSRTHIVGAIIPTLDNEIFARQVSGLQNTLSEQGFTLLLGCSNYESDEGYRQAQVMLSKGVEALVILGYDHPAELFSMVRAAGIPYVVTYSFETGSAHPSIGFDNRAAFSRMTRHLLDKGHRDFASFLQLQNNNDRVVARMKGIVDTLNEAGITLAPENIFRGPSSIEFGEASFIALAERAERLPTAIICGNDNIAIGAIMAAQRMGIDVSHDVAITGFDDLAISSRILPALTTMRVDNYGIGNMAAQKLLYAIEHFGTDIESVEFSASIIPRLSSEERR